MKTQKIILCAFIAFIVCIQAYAQPTSKFRKQKKEIVAALVKDGSTKYFESLPLAFKEIGSNDTLFIREGVHMYEATLEIWEVNNVAIIGEGKCQLICDNTNDNVMWIITCENILIRNIHATHTKPSEGESCVGNVFALDNGMNITIENCDINGCGAIGVYAFGTENILLKNNEIHDNTLWAVEYNGKGMLEEMWHEQVKFENNKIYDNRKGLPIPDNYPEDGE